MRNVRCPSCGLRLKLSGPAAEMEFCPRCLARARRVVRMLEAAPERCGNGGEGGPSAAAEAP